MRAVILSGGTYSYYGDPEFCRGFVDGADLIVAADSGGGALLKLGIPKGTPTVIIGDMDSIDQADLASLRRLKKSGGDLEIIREPAEKDSTDTELAFDVALKKGADEIVILGALGGRVDHALANLSLLIRTKSENGKRRKKVEAKIVDEYQEITLLDAGIKNRIEGDVGETVSLISLKGDAEGVITNDLKYPLSDAILAQFSPLGVSNVISGADPWVLFKRGLLLLVRVKKV
ncbi:MAG: thiamine diphosphokinase [Deltaproteobacteria bacterium]|uniref:Thiamine diphosphokinase n=1 Tax=Candidatus Zymogenus saltonus TaxID=2844893 RepID=A0A9D8PM18_9DELT|nr:thiamine diphosphokinase [Candidatus Zymogenus saltonus]